MSEYKLSLADRMKMYESLNNDKLCPGIPFLIRLDGKGFSKRIKQWNCKKPFDETFRNIMIQTSKKLFEEVADANLVYTGSDEITILFYEKDILNPWYGKRVNKLLSLTASIATATFNMEAMKSRTEKYFDVIKYPAYFDSRIIQVPSLSEGYNNIIYRQQDIIRNSISGWARHFYSTKQLTNKNSDDKIKMMKDKDFDYWNDAYDWSIYGTLLVKINVIYDMETKLPQYSVVDPCHVPEKYFNTEKYYIRKQIHGVNEKLYCYKIDSLNNLNISANELISGDKDKNDQDFVSVDYLEVFQ